MTNQDTGRELAELRKEIVEARNQAIKTDNQIKNLALDLKGFEKRFEALERRTRIASLGANVIVALVILGAAYLVHAVRVAGLDEALAAAAGEADQLRREGAQKSQRLEQQLAAREQLETRRTTAHTTLGELFKALDAGQERQAERLLEQLDFAAADPLVQRLAESRVRELRRKLADNAYKSGKANLAAGRTQPGLADLQRVVTLEPDGRLVLPARYLMATHLWKLNRYAELVPLLRELKQGNEDRAMVEEVNYMLGASLARLGEANEALPLLKQLVTSSGRYGAAAKPLLAALETGEPVPGAVASSAPEQPAKPQAPAAAPAPGPKAPATPATP